MEEEIKEREKRQEGRRGGTVRVKNMLFSIELQNLSLIASFAHCGKTELVSFTVSRLLTSTANKTRHFLSLDMQGLAFLGKEWRDSEQFNECDQCSLCVGGTKRQNKQHPPQ